MVPERAINCRNEVLARFRLLRNFSGKITYLTLCCCLYLETAVLLLNNFVFGEFALLCATVPESCCLLSVLTIVFMLLKKNGIKKFINLSMIYQ